MIKWFAIVSNNFQDVEEPKRNQLENYFEREIEKEKTFDEKLYADLISFLKTEALLPPASEPPKAPKANGTPASNGKPPKKKAKQSDRGEAKTNGIPFCLDDEESASESEENDPEEEEEEIPLRV